MLDHINSFYTNNLSQLNRMREGEGGEREGGGRGEGGERKC